MESAYHWLFLTALFVLAPCLLLALVQAVRGPRIADRIVGINMLGSMTLAVICILAAMLHENWLLDVSLVYGMLSFLAVVVLARAYIAGRGKRHG